MKSIYSEEQRYRYRVTSAAREAGMTQAYLARKIGIRAETLSRKMNGDPFTEKEMRRIQRLFGWKRIEGESI